MGAEAFLRKNYPGHFDVCFDRTFALANYVTILDEICNYYRKPLPEVFAGKRVLHIGSGPGYFLGLVRKCGGVAVGVEPYLGSENAIKGKIEDVMLDGKFNIIVAQDVFVSSVFFGSLGKVMEKLVSVLNGILVVDNRKDEDIINGLQFRKQYYGERALYTLTRR